MGSRLDCIRDWEQRAEKAHYRVAVMATGCQVTERQLRRYFQEKFGLSPRQWITQQRALRIQARLAEGALVKEASAEAGFAHQQNLSRHFKHHFKIAPSELRRPRP